MKRILPFLLLLTLASWVYPQEVITLSVDDAIRLALENHIPYQLSQLGVRLSRQKLMETGSNLLPQVSLQGQKILDKKVIVIHMPPIFPGMPPEGIDAQFDMTMNYEFTLQVIQPVFTGGKILLSTKNAKIDLDIAKEKEKSSQADTILDVKKTFYSILVLQEFIKVQEEALGLAQNNLANIQQSFDLGMASQYDLLRAELVVGGIKPEILKVDNLLQTTLANLKMILGIAADRAVALKGSLAFDPVQIGDEKTVTLALDNRSEIRQLKMEKKKINNLLKVTWAQFVPDLSLVGRWTYRANDFRFTESNWDDYYTVAIGMNWNIFTGLRRSAQVGEAYVARKMLDLNLKLLNDATRLEVENRIRTLKQENENIVLQQKNMETAKEGVRIAELSFKEGLITILELNSSYTELTRAKVNYLQALFNYNIAIAELEKLSGSKINGGSQ